MLGFKKHIINYITGKIKMRSYGINKRAFLLFVIFILVVSGTAFFIIKALNQWTEDVIDGKKLLTEVVINKLESSAQTLLDSLNNANFFREDSLTKKEVDLLDSKLKKLVSQELSDINGMEAGFYFPQLHEFYGYSFPTSPPPEPVFGPPPRSYNIIKLQVLKSIEDKSLIINLHQFDPAIFPLATKPIYNKGKIIAAVWTRIHIERELPTIKLSEVLQIAGAVSLLGFLITLYISIRLRRQTDEIRAGLEILQKDTSYKFRNMSGVFGFIGLAINRMVEALTNEHYHIQKLERELHQKDKMAVLGKLIAGVAHEVKTPLAIIKTRIQIWQQSLKRNNMQLVDKAITNESLQLVVNEINRLSNLVKRLLIFSKPIADNLFPVDINQLIFQTTSFLQTETSKAISFETKLDNKIPCIKADINSLEQVFMNIIINSLESMPDGGVLTVESLYLKDKGFIRILISDTGKGIPDDIKGKIFDPFYTTKENGTGLGLAIANEIVKAHKGEVCFYPNSPAGTVFEIMIPVN